MEEIKKITKIVITNLQQKNLNITPNNYFKEFYKEAKLNTTFVKECEVFEEIKSSLSNDELQFFNHIETFEDLAVLLSKRTDDDKIKTFIKVLNELLSPSVDFSIENEINYTIDEMIDKPKEIFEEETIIKLKSLSEKRIKHDRAILRKKTGDIIKLSSLMGKYFDKSLLESSNSSEEIATIKEELEELNISDSSERELDLLQTKLVDTIYNIEKTMLKNSKELNENKNQFAHLHETIIKLQKELEKAKEETSIDYLTNILNRRAYHNEVEKIEKKHEIFNTNYAVIFYDIDYFKKINDTHGHTCGDHILKTFAGILNKLTRESDTIARYGGEEFIALVTYHDREEIKKYVKRVKSIINENFFVYNDIKVKIKFSAGISYRDNYDSYIGTKKRADDLLYQAKDLGRNKIIFDDGVII